jgi:hypothetical protein
MKPKTQATDDVYQLLIGLFLSLLVLRVARKLSLSYKSDKATQSQEEVEKEARILLL